MHDSKTPPEPHTQKPIFETLVCVVLVLVAVPFAWWTMMAELSCSVDDFILDVQYSSRHRKRIRKLRAPPLLDSSGLVPLLLLPAPRQAGRACSASCVLFSYSCRNSFDLMTAESFSHFCSCNFWHQLKSLTIPEAIRHPTRETQEHRVTSTHSAAAPSACGSFKCGGSYCPMCDFLGRMVLLTKRLRSNVCAAARCGSRR